MHGDVVSSTIPGQSRIFGTVVTGLSRCRSNFFLSTDCTSVRLFLQWKWTVFCLLSVQAWLAIQVIVAQVAAKFCLVLISLAIAVSLFPLLQYTQVVARYSHRFY